MPRVLFVSLLTAAFFLLFPAGNSAWARGAGPARTGETALDPRMSIIPSPVDRGGPGRVILSDLDLIHEPAGVFDGKPIFFFATRKGLTGLFGADIMLEPGLYPLIVNYIDGRGQPFQLSQTLRVQDKDYGTRNISVPQSQVDLSAADLDRAAKEKALTDAALATVSPIKLWRGPFLEPVKAAINSSFGRQTRMNGILNPRPHAGADYRAPAGAPVQAPAAGRVILAGDHFFAGNSIYIDHGQGLISMYFHLSKILVSEGQVLEKGEGPIGLVGQTGRVTGAHLHYGVYLNGARIDPPAFRKMTDDLEDY